MASKTPLPPANVTTLDVSLTKIKVYPGMSEETTCFEAELRLDGKKVGRVSNRGFGGSHEYDVDRASMELLQSFAKLLPPREHKGRDGGTAWIEPPSVERIIDDLLDLELDAREIAKLRKRFDKDLRIRIFTVDEQGRIKRTGAHHPEGIASLMNSPVYQARLAHAGEKMLNGMGDALAFDYFLRGVAPHLADRLNGVGL